MHGATSPWCCGMSWGRACEGRWVSLCLDLGPNPSRACNKLSRNPPLFQGPVLWSLALWELQGGGPGGQGSSATTGDRLSCDMMQCVFDRLCGLFTRALLRSVLGHARSPLVPSRQSVVCADSGEGEPLPPIRPVAGRPRACFKHVYSGKVYARGQ